MDASLTISSNILAQEPTMISYMIHSGELMHIPTRRIFRALYVYPPIVAAIFAATGRIDRTEKIRLSRKIRWPVRVSSELTYVSPNMLIYQTEYIIMPVKRTSLKAQKSHVQHEFSCRHGIYDLFGITRCILIDIARKDLLSAALPDQV